MTAMTNNKEIRIFMKNGDKESELRIDTIQEENKLALIDGFFRFFDISIDFKEMAETYLKVGTAFKDFYSRIENNEITESNENIKLLTPKSINTEVKHHSSTSSEVQRNAWNWQNKEDSSQINSKPIVIDRPEHLDTGIKEKNGSNRYRCRYVCPKCKTKANHYIPETLRQISCHSCCYKMNVKPSTKEGFPNKDSFSNFFVAGDFEIGITSEGVKNNGDSQEYRI